MATVSLIHENPKFLRNEKVIAMYNDDFFLSRVLKIRRSKHGYKYLIHYVNWNSLWDEWLTEEKIFKITKENFEKYEIDPPKNLYLPTDEELRAEQEPKLANIKFRNLKSMKYIEEESASPTKLESEQEKPMPKNSKMAKPGPASSKGSKPKQNVKPSATRVSITVNLTPKNKTTSKATLPSRSRQLSSNSDDFMSAEETLSRPSPHKSRLTKTQAQPKVSDTSDSSIMTSDEEVFVSPQMSKSGAMTIKDRSKKQHKATLNHERNMNNNKKDNGNKGLHESETSGINSSQILNSPEQEKKNSRRYNETGVSYFASASSDDEDDDEPHLDQGVSCKKDQPKSKFEIPLPDALRFILINDHSLIHYQNKLIKLPSQINVKTILQTFRSSVMEELTKREMIYFAHQFDFMEECFDHLLPKELLYKRERKSQLKTIVSSTNKDQPSLICGGIHLLRFLAKLETILNTCFVDMMTPEEIDLSERLLLKLFNFLEDRKSELFSESKVYYKPSSK